MHHLERNYPFKIQSYKRRKNSCRCRKFTGYLNTRFPVFILTTELYRLLPFRFLLLIISILISNLSGGQCIVVTGAAKYNEDFEANSGNWSTGGTASDWGWGTPAKAIITGPVSGQRCWITGSLTGTSYTANQRSFLVSPCFDFTGLQNPFISLDVFWETETRYDGSLLQYSLDYGVTWTNLGTANEAPNCLNSNWYNTSQISNLTGLTSVRDGWSGTTKSISGCGGGNGSGGWIKATHVLSGLAGKSNVRLRFSFGAGTLCNEYDGFALDNIQIGEAPSFPASFTYTCTASNKVSFNNTSPLCPDFFWNFGDAASGTANTSTLRNPVHTFSGPGYYPVTLTVSTTGSPSSTYTRYIRIMSATVTTSGQSICSTNNTASITAILNTDAATTGISYSWNTIPPNSTPALSNVGPGTYSVTISADSACTINDSIILIQRVPIAASVSVSNSSCSNASGIAQITVSGGLSPYTFNWNPAVATGPSSNSLAPGNYTVLVQDTQGCTDTVKFVVNSIGSKPVIDTIASINPTCYGGANGTATAFVSAGLPPYSYAWKKDAETYSGTSIKNIRSGTYILTATDNSGCTAIKSVTLFDPPAIQVIDSTRSTSCGFNNGFAKIHATNGLAPYQYLWSTGSRDTVVSGLAAGQYSMLITDAKGCVLNYNQIVINRSIPLKIFLGSDTTICPGNELVLSPGLFTKYRWQDNSADTSFVVKTSGTYSVNVIDNAGCTASASRRVVVECRDIVFPTAFTPNSDSRNDVFGPVGTLSAISNYSLKIFNRWGQIIFATNDPLKKWNGRAGGIESATGTYVYTADYTFDRRPPAKISGTFLLIK